MSLSALAQSEPLVLELVLNAGAPQMARALRRPDGTLLIGRADLLAMRVALPEAPAAVVDGVAYDDVSALPGSALEFDESTQSARLRLAPGALRATAVSAETPAPLLLSDSVFGAFVNYDLAAQTGGGMHDRASGLLDAAVSNRWGLATSSFLVGAASGSDGESPARTVRLESALRFDDPARLTRLTVGDSVTQGAVWSTPLRFGGVQYGTQFGLRPGFISYPTPTLNGGAALPSAVEVYVNDSLRYRGRVEPGPFALNQLPVLTGAGEMRFTVTDALGVGRSVTTPYYVSTALLRPGLSDYSVEAGWTRLHFGLRGNDYGRPFAAGNWRHGLDETLTADFHGEGSARTQAAGAGLSLVWAPVGEFAVHGALSNSANESRRASESGEPGSGHLVRASYAHLGSDWSFAANRLVASPGFAQVGWEDSAVHIRSQSQVFAGRSFGRAGSLGTSYTLLRYSSGERIALLSLSYSTLMAERVFLSMYASRAKSGTQRDTTVGFMLTLPFGERQNASLASTRQNGRLSTSVNISQPPPTDAGFGYRVSATRGEIDRSQAQAVWRSRYTTLGVEAAAEAGLGAARLTASGTVGYAGGVPFALQQPAEALALVTVEGAPGVTVYLENQPVARTDAEGRAVVPGLRPYELNRLLVDSNELSIAARVQSDALTVVPRSRGVATARFEIGRGNALSATVAVVMPDGQPLAAGATARAASRPEALVAGHGGVLWVDGPVADERFEVRWPGGVCAFEAGPVPSSGPLPRLGPYTCEPVP